MTDVPKIGGLIEHQVLTLTRARNFEQYVHMIEEYLAGKCLFCDPLGSKNVVLHETDGWRLWENPFPESNTALHLVLASVRHISTEQLPGVEEFIAVGKLFAWAKERYADRMQGGGVLMRFGSPEFNAGTILHLHAHILVPNLKGEVRLPLAKDVERNERGYKRLHVFEKLRGGGSQLDLTDEERALIDT